MSVIDQSGSAISTSSDTSTHELRHVPATSISPSRIGARYYVTVAQGKLMLTLAQPDGSE